MSKKTKATLYLEKDTIEQAKKSNFNISEIANRALRERLGLEKETKRQESLRQLLESGKREGKLYFMPFHIKSLELENVGKFNDLKLEFSDGLNLIYGPNGSGKTTIFESIKKVFDPDSEENVGDFVKQDKNRGRVSIKIEAENNKVEKNFNVGGRTIKEFKERGVVIADDLFIGLDEEDKSEIFDDLRESIESQMIVTTVNRDLAQLAGNAIKLYSYTEERKKEIEERIAGLSMMLEENKKDLEYLEKKIKETEAERGRLKKSQYEFESLKDQKAKFGEYSSELNIFRNELESEIENTEQKFENIESEREKGRLEERLKHLRNELAEKNSEYEDLVSRKEDIQEKMSMIDMEKDRLESLREKIERMMEEKNATMDKIDALEGEIKELKDEREEIESRLEG